MILQCNKEEKSDHFQCLHQNEQIQIDPHLIALAQLRNPEATITELDQLSEDQIRRGKSQPVRPSPVYHKFWFSTPETCEETENLYPLYRRIYIEILKFQQLDSIDPINNPTDRNVPY